MGSNLCYNGHMETFVFVNGHLVERFSQALQVEPGSTIYLSNNTPLRVLTVEVQHGMQTITAETLVE